jgi:integrase/recombinase XerD
MTREFKSVFAGPIKELIALHKALGYKFDRAMPYLHQIDNFALASNEISQGISMDFAKKWRERQEGESEYHRYTRVLYLSKLSRFLVDSGIDSIVPKLPRKPKPSFVPYIFSREQVDNIFVASDQLQLQVFNKEANLISVPAILRALYSAGLRLGEAINLSDADVNLKEGWLNIQKSKNGRQRKIRIHFSLIEVLKQFVDHRNLLPLESKPETFFVKSNGKKCGDLSLRTFFIQCLKAANIPYIGGGRGPRMHDLRHSFATHTLVDMINSGVDVYEALPHLSVYLGHDSIVSTAGYIRLTAQIYPDIMKGALATSRSLPIPLSL